MNNAFLYFSAFLTVFYLFIFFYKPNSVALVFVNLLSLFMLVMYILGGNENEKIQ